MIKGIKHIVVEADIKPLKRSLGAVKTAEDATKGSRVEPYFRTEGQNLYVLVLAIHKAD